MESEGNKETTAGTVVEEISETCTKCRQITSFKIQPVYCENCGMKY